jgi:cell division inhibitor SepF
MAVLDKFKSAMNSIGVIGDATNDETEEFEYSEKGESVEQPKKVVRKQKRGFGISNDISKIHVSKPESFDDAKEVVDALKEDTPIVLDLSKVAETVAERVRDYCCGSISALDGNIKKISGTIFLLTPNSIDIEGDTSSVSE